MTHLRLAGVAKLFSETVAVREFNLDVAKGEFISLLGPSGCGKTTTLRMVAGFEHPTHGTITLEGEDVTYHAPERRNMGVVFQSYALFPNLTVAQNIAFGLQVRKRPAREIAQHVADLLALTHLDAFGQRYPAQLSGGQQQRVALARALAIQPRVLLLDEPLSALDAKIRVELRHEIRRIQQTLGITTIYVTHDQEEALAISDRIVVMNAGQIEQIGTPFAIYNDPATEFVARFVGQINLLPVSVVDAAQGLVRVGEQVVRTLHRTQLSSERVRLAIRPEELSPGHAEGANHLTGRVDSITYLGALVRVHLQVEETLLLVDLLNERAMTLPVVGAPLTVHFSPDACRLL